MITKNLSYKMLPPVRIQLVTSGFSVSCSPGIAYKSETLRSFNQALLIPAKSTKSKQGRVVRTKVSLKIPDLHWTG